MSGPDRGPTPASVDADPGEVGMSADRLARIDRHFSGYVEDGRLAGWQVAVSRHGRVVHHSTCGLRDVEAAIPWSPDTVARLYSMTKPVTSVAAMMLHEEGRLALTDPVHRYLPKYRTCRIFRTGSTAFPQTTSVGEPMRIRHLFTHTSGLTYGWHHRHVTDALYRQAGYELGVPDGVDLATACQHWAALPLVAQPGTQWNYGVSTDVLGRVVEVISGQPLDEFVTERILQPLGMHDTAYHVAGRTDRVARLYQPSLGGGALQRSPQEVYPTERPSFVGGGSGLWGTAADYLRFCHMLLGRGALGGTRILGSRTVDLMTSNHLPGGADMEDMQRPEFADGSSRGEGMGLGVSVMLDPIANGAPSSVGEFAWGGAASTVFWCDPVEDLAVVFLTQLLLGAHPIRHELKRTVYQALVD